MSCGDDGIDIPDIPLAGEIDGEVWEFKFGNAYLEKVGTVAEYKYLLLSTDETTNDPCSIRATTNPHLRMILPLGTGSYSIPLAQFDETVKFDLGDGTVISATSGFIEIFGSDLNQLVGYIQADAGEGFLVEGRFVIEIC